MIPNFRISMNPHAATESKKPAPGTFWRHYKSQWGLDHTYEVVGIAKHSETEEVLVTYRPLYEVLEDNWVYGADFAVRPVSMWFDTVEWKGALSPRFLRIEDPRTRKKP